MCFLLQRLRLSARNYFHLLLNKKMNCSVLSVAGTGSTFLWKNVNAFYNRSEPHNHMKIKTAAGCAFLTLRDPADRLSSGFLYEYMYPNNGRPRLTQFPSASSFVNALSNTTNADHRRAIQLYRQSLSKQHPGDDGSFFLFPMSRYMNDFPTTFHIFCTECLTTLWRNFTNSSRLIGSQMMRSKSATDSQMRRATLSFHQKRLFHSFYAEDVRLYRRFCTPCRYSVWSSSALSMRLNHGEHRDEGGP